MKRSAILSAWVLLGAGFMNFQVPAPIQAEQEAPLPAAPKLNTLPTVVTQSFAVVSLKAHAAGLYSVAASLNGAPCRLLLDTGASHTTFTRAFIAGHFPYEPLSAVALASGSNVTSATQRITVKSLRVGESEFTAFAGVVLPIDHLSQTVGEPVDGILGMNVLRMAPFILSCGKSAFQWVSADERAHWQERELYGELNDQGTFTLNARLRDRLIPMVIDSGANKSFVSEAYWSKKQNRPARLAMADINAKAGTAPATYFAGIPEILMLGPGVMLREAAPVLFEEERLGIFGTDFLRRLDILIDVPVNRIYAVEHKRP